jgi:hypothetical protein
LTGEDSWLSLRCLRIFDSVVFLRVSVLLRTVVWLVEHGARILVWGVEEVAGTYPRLCVLFPCSLPSSHAGPEHVTCCSPRLAPNWLEMVLPSPVQRILAWVLKSLIVKYFSLYYLTSDNICFSCSKCHFSLHLFVK